MRRVRSRLAGGDLAQRRLCRGEARDRHAVRRARHVVEADLMTERHRGGIAAVLTADADLDVRSRLAAAQAALGKTVASQA